MNISQKELHALVYEGGISVNTARFVSQLNLRDKDIEKPVGELLRSAAKLVSIRAAINGFEARHKHSGMSQWELIVLVTDIKNIAES